MSPSNSCLVTNVHYNFIACFGKHVFTEEKKNNCGKIRVPKVSFRFFDKLKNEIQSSVLRFCFYFNKEDEIQITDHHFHV